MLKRTLPKWTDEAGIAKLADQIVAEHELAYRSFKAYADEEEPLCGESILDDLVNQFVRAERAAFKAAVERGDIAPLAALLQDENWYWLKPETRALMVEFMTGARNPKTGRRKARGRPPMTVDAKLAANPMHRAGRDALLVIADLRRLYPEVPSAEVRTRVIRIFAEWAGITDEALRHYLDRSRNDPHRLKRHPLIAVI